MFRTAVDDKYAITDDFQLGQNSFQSQSNVKLAALPSGGFVAVWAGQDGFNNPGVRLQMYDGNGRPVGSESPVNLDASGGQGSPSVTALASGGFVVTWTTESPYPVVVDIHAQLFDGSGARVGAEFLVNSTTAGFQVGPEITGLAGGGFVISWEQQNDSGFDDIRAQVFNSAGAKVSASRRCTRSIRIRPTP